MKWTPEMDAELVKLWQSHYSAKQIAEKMGNVTRNSVIGRAHRILKKEDSPIQSRGAGRHPPENIRAPRAKTIALLSERRRINGVFSVTRPKAIQPVDMPKCEDLHSLHITLDELERHHCRWPSGDGPFTFCGHQKFNGFSYCPTHYFQSIGNGTPSERAATRIAPHKLAGAW